jgi:hypothetical protein
MRATPRALPHSDRTLFPITDGFKNMRKRVGEGRPGPGRPKGTLNKLTLAAKEALEYAFDAIGGQDALAAWAKENPTEFFKLFAKLIPARHELTGANGGPVEIEQRYAGYSDADLDKLIAAKVIAIGISVKAETDDA